MSPVFAGTPPFPPAKGDLAFVVLRWLRLKDKVSSPWVEHSKAEGETVGAWELQDERELEKGSLAEVAGSRGYASTAGAVAAQADVCARKVVNSGSMYGVSNQLGLQLNIMVRYGLGTCASGKAAREVP